MSTGIEHPKIVAHEGKLYEFNDGDLLFGYQQQQNIPTSFPWIGWKGESIPFELWQTILAFFVWSQNTYKSESLVYLYYNPTTGDWLAWAPPQRGIGMSVKSIDDHVGMKQSESFVGYYKVGTGHHHCTASAFQSGTDASDENPQNGIHFTIGKIGEKKLDLHARAILNGNSCQVYMDDWVALPPEFDQLNSHPNLEKLLQSAYDIMLTSAPPSGLQFPQQWKDNFSNTYQSVTAMSSGGVSLHDYRSKMAGSGMQMGFGHGTWELTSP
jgi:hypothetical protein